MTAALLARAARFEEGAALIDSVRLKMAPREVGLRALAATLSRVSGESYRPRFGRLERLFDSIRDGSLGGGATLHGCIVAPAPRAAFAFGTGTLTISREPGRTVSEKSAAPAAYKDEVPAKPPKQIKKQRRN
jgi:hypothetical protein